MAFGVTILGSIQTVAVNRDADPAGYITGVKITLLSATVLLALAAVALVTLHRSRRPSPDASPAIPSAGRMLGAGPPVDVMSGGQTQL